MVRHIYQHIHKSDKKKSAIHKRMQFLLILIIIITVMYYAYKTLQKHLATLPTTSMAKTCILQLGYCKMYLTGDKSIELTISPIPIRSEKDLSFELIIKNINVKSAKLYITPVPINLKSKKIKQLNKGKSINLKQTGNFSYTQHTKLPIVAGERDWFIVANVKTLTGEDYSILFTFSSTGPSRSLLEVIPSSLNLGVSASSLAK